MNVEGSPNVCFKVTDTPKKFMEEFPKLLVQKLGKKVDSISRKINWRPNPRQVRFIKVLINKKSFFVIIEPSPYGNNEVILMVESLDKRLPIELRLGYKQKVSYINELEFLCREIHEVLTEIPGASALRWYFESSSYQGSAVRTPDELPWNW